MYMAVAAAVVVRSNFALSDTHTLSLRKVRSTMCEKLYPTNSITKVLSLPNLAITFAGSTQLVNLSPCSDSLVQLGLMWIFIILIITI